MEQNKICTFCNKQMIYGKRTQVLSKHVYKNNEYISKSIKFDIYCWYCNMEDDMCDIVLDKKDEEKNKNLYEKANKYLEQWLHQLSNE